MDFDPQKATKMGKELVLWKRALENAKQMVRFDAVSFGPLMKLADSVYTETKLEDKLTGIMNRFETRTVPLIETANKRSAGGVELV